MSDPIILKPDKILTITGAASKYKVAMMRSLKGIYGVIFLIGEIFTNIF